MTMKEYVDVLRMAIKMQIQYKEEALQECDRLNEDYVEGILTGLRIALEKIDASMFLVEKYN